MGYYMAITGIKPDGTKTKSFIVGKCYGYNEPKDGLMLGYVYIIQSESFRESMQEEREEQKGYTDYDILYQREVQQLRNGYKRIIYLCSSCGERIARESWHGKKLIGSKQAPGFPRCPYCGKR